MCNYIDNSRFSDRFSFFQNFDTIAVIPFPHLNLINCIGMGQKDDYLIWREKNGFFSALDRKSNLKTWSMITGKLLYSEQQKFDGSERSLKSYDVYRSTDDDITYTTNFYNQEHMSLSLLKSRKPIVDKNGVIIKNDDRILSKSKLEEKATKQR